ncbi:MAG: tRNA (guanine(6)-N2)-methyltransferase [Candidatus Bathyarchaeota archaeon BA1]|nr:MAG: tRNA (guanine(6)-N2)-methyltransferase [Candidatus Bathyarchaeota archaeon BA1]
MPSSVIEPKLKFDSVIIRYGGEMGIKGAWTRRLYERHMLDNIRNMLKHHRIHYDVIIRKRGRLYLKTPSATEASSKLSRVFGISSLSPAIETTSRLSDIVTKSISLAGSTFQKGNSFAVRCKRAGDHPFTSADVCKEVGHQILAEFPKLGLKVDLENPDVMLGIEIREDSAFLYTSVVDGAGGLPLGAQPRVVCLLSGGIDSPVACWLAMKRGCPIVPVYFDNAPFTDESTTNRALSVAKVLFEWAVGFPRRMYIVRHGQNLAEFKVRPRLERLTCILCKRMMYRLAERIADMRRAEGIVTGEAIGEQASQTLRNLRVLSMAITKYPIHRPLLGFDKAETERMARKIGTYEASIQRAKGCAAAPRKPATMARPQEVAEAEEALNIGEMIEKSVKSLKIVDL